MAIQVAGTEVLSNARSLNNITAVDSTTATTLIDAGFGGGGIEFTRKITTYTAVAGEGIIADTDGGAWTLTLPQNPETGDNVVIRDGGDWSANNLTVVRNGSTIEGDDENMLLNIGGASVDLVYDGVTWQIYVQVGVSSGTTVTETGTQTLTNKTLTSPTLTSATLSGTPVAPTATAGTSTTQVATTDFVTNEVEWTTTTVYDSVTDGEINSVEITFVDGFEYMLFGDGLGLSEGGGLGFKVQMDSQPSNTGVFDVPFTSAGANENNFLLDLKLARVATSGRVLSCLIGNQADADSSGFTASSNGSIVVFSVTDTRASPDKIKKVFFYASGSAEFDLGLIKLMKRRVNYV